MRREQPPLLGPHDIQIEQEVLGCLLVYNSAHKLIEGIVRVEDFYEPVHAEIYDICSKLITMGKAATPSTVKAYLPNDFEIAEGLKVSEYLARLAASATTLISVKDHAGIIRDLSDYRAIFSVVEMASTVRGIDSDPEKAATAAIDMLDAIVAERSLGQVPSLTLRASVVRAVDAAAKAYQNDGVISGMSWGLRDLDIKTSGFQKGELTILAGRPGMMKTGLALNMSRALCRGGHKGIFFALEMGDVSITRRMMSDLLFDIYELPYFRIRSGNFSETDFHHLQKAALIAAEFPLRIEQQTGLTLAQISARARQAKRRDGLDFIVVDHMGHVQASERYAGNKVNEIGEVSSGLLRLARELDLGVLALCQLNRGVESREDKRPGLSDLRASGNIEEDAATVLMVYREAYYLANREPKAGTPEYELWQNKMVLCFDKLQILIEKQREGPSGAIDVFVNVACNAVRSLGWQRGEDELSRYLPDNERLLF